MLDYTGCLNEWVVSGGGVDGVVGVVDDFDGVCDVMCNVVCDIVCDGLYGGEGFGKVE